LKCAREGGYVNEATQQTVSDVPVFEQIDSHLSALLVADRRIGKCLSELPPAVAV
jgi:hypothetical protein